MFYSLFALLGLPILHMAILSDDVDIAVSIIHHGADVNQTFLGKLPIELVMDNISDENDVYYITKHLVLAGASISDVPVAKRRHGWYGFRMEYYDYWVGNMECDWDVLCFDQHYQMCFTKK